MEVTARVRLVLLLAAACSPAAGRSGPPRGTTEVERRPIFDEDTPAAADAERAIPMCWAGARFVAIRHSRSNDGAELLAWDDLAAPPRSFRLVAAPGTIACAPAGDRVALLPTPDDPSPSIGVLDLTLGGLRTVAGPPHGVTSMGTTLALSPDGALITIAVRTAAGTRVWTQRVDDGVVVDSRVEKAPGPPADARAESRDRLFVVTTVGSTLGITGVDGRTVQFEAPPGVDLSVKDGINNLFEGRGPQWVGGHGLVLGDWRLDLETLALRRLFPAGMQGRVFTAPDGRLALEINGQLRRPAAP